MHGLNFKFSPLLTEPVLWQGTDGGTGGSFVWALPGSEAVGWTLSFNDHLTIGRHFSLQCVLAAGPHGEGNGRTLCQDCSSSDSSLRIPTFWFPSKYLAYFHFYQKNPNCSSLAKPNLFQPRSTEQFLVKQKQYHHTAECCMKELLEAILPLILFITESLRVRISKHFPFSAPQFSHPCPRHNEVFSNYEASRLSTLRVVKHSSLSS